MIHFIAHKAQISTHKVNENISKNWKEQCRNSASAAGN